MTSYSDPPPFSKFEWILALRYLRSRRKEGFISVIAGFSFLGIMLGVATLIIVMAVMNGFREELFDKILGLNGHVVVQRLSRDFTDYEAMSERMRAIKGVRSVLPLVEGQVMISSVNAAHGALVRGLNEEDLKHLSSVADNIRFGTLEGFEEKQSIALGIRLAGALNIGIGDAVTLVSPRGAATPFGISPRVKRYKVAAIFEIGMSEYDNTIVFMSLKEAQRYFNMSGAVNLLEIVVENPDKVADFHTPLLHAGGEGIVLSDWRQRNSSFFNALQVERNVMFLILTLIILVAALNIVSGLIMLVKDKGRDIAILRTMGATRGAIMRIFFITGASIGITGTLAGLILGVSVCLNIESIRQGISWFLETDIFSPELYYLSQMPASMDRYEVIYVLLMTFVISILATLYPSWRASTLDPVEALRYE